MTVRGRSFQGYAMHFWTGSRYACGLASAVYSTERPDLVSCRRCRPAAQKAHSEWLTADNSKDTSHAE